MVLKHSDSSPSKKKTNNNAKTDKSMGKVVCINFKDILGMLLVDMVPKGNTVNANYYSKVIRRDLLNAIRKKSRELKMYCCIKITAHIILQTHVYTTQLEIDVLGF